MIYILNGYLEIINLLLLHESINVNAIYEEKQSLHELDDQFKSLIDQRRQTPSVHAKYKDVEIV